MQVLISSGNIDGLVEWITHHVTPMLDQKMFYKNSIITILVVLVILFLFGVVYNKKEKTTTGKASNFLESLVSFILHDISIENLGREKGIKWAPFFCTLFFLILGCNLAGLIPGSSTVTGSFFATGAFAIIVLFCMTVIPLVKHGPIKYLKGFIPEGVPAFVLVLLTPLELMGLLVKSISLTIRLFANMMAGHIVLYSIIGMTVALGYFALPSLLVGIAIYALEVFVACLQAYLFTLLSSLFIGEVFHHVQGHHEDDHAH